MRKSEKGFTLIELMIVVAIIGILTAIAVPNFTRFQAKARQSEAKVNLKALYTAIKSNRADTGLYECGLCGYAPEQGNLYHYFATATATVAGSDADCKKASDSGATPAQKNPTSTVDGTFTAVAAANIDGDSYCDGWSINQDNTLSNVKNDVTN